MQLSLISRKKKKKSIVLLVLTHMTLRNGTSIWSIFLHSSWSQKISDTTPVFVQAKWVIIILYHFIPRPENRQFLVSSQDNNPKDLLLLNLTLKYRHILDQWESTLFRSWASKRISSKASSGYCIVYLGRELSSPSAISTARFSPSPHHQPPPLLSTTRPVQHKRPYKADTFGYWGFCLVLYSLC